MRILVCIFSLFLSTVYAKDSSLALSGSLAFVSDYRDRGISQTFCKSALQAEVNVQHRSGYYFKSALANVDGTSHYLNNTSLEWDFAIGRLQPLFYSFSYDIGLLYYFYPGGESNTPKRVSYNTLEYYTAIKRGGLECKVSVTITDFFGVNSDNPPFNWEKMKLAKSDGHSIGSSYLEMNYTHPLGQKWKVAAHVGYQAVINYPELNYLDWLLELNREFAGFTANISYVESNAKKAFYRVRTHTKQGHFVFLGGAEIYLGLKRSF